MSAPRELPRRVVVAGDGQLGAFAAVALARTLPGTEVIVIGAPPDPAALADRIGTALPFGNRIHDRFGLDEQALVREAGASHRLVVRYEGWVGAGRAGAAPYGAAIDPKLRTGFSRAWGGGPRNATAATPPGSLAEVLAAQGRFQPAAGAPDAPLADVEYSLRWNVPAACALLGRAAQAAGVRYVKGRISGVAPDGAGGIAELAVEGRGTISADLYVDCTGPGAALLSRLPEFGFRDWAAHLPIRSVVFGRPGEPMVSLVDRMILTDAGWLAELAGRDGRQLVLGMAEGIADDAAVTLLGGEPEERIALAPGRTEQAWLGNVVALGDAAVRFEPLGWLNLDIAHRQLDLLLELMPGVSPDPRERAEFNRRSALMADRVRDVLGAHYAAPAASARFPGLARSEELALALDQFVRRGRQPFFEEAPLLTQELAALFDALGHERGEGAVARAADPRAAQAAEEAFAARAGRALQDAPPYAAWLGAALGGQRAG